MKPHDQAISFLTDRGFYAARRDWAPGATVIVSRGRKRVGEIDQLDGLIWIVWREGLWNLEAPLSTPGGIVERGYSTLQACERAIEYLTADEDLLMEAFGEARKSFPDSTVLYQFPDRLPISQPKRDIPTG